jgi:putative restriction endonuclease
MEEDLPPLTILVRSAGGKLGAGFIAWDHARLEEGQDRVFSWPWHQHENPFAPWRSGERMDLLVREVLDAPLQAAEVFARLRVRGVQQQVFRAVLMELYEGACAVSGSTVEVGLEACHIIPWAEASGEEAFLPQNGILMSAWYHRLFDAGLLEIDEEYVVRIPKQLLADAAPADREALRAVSGQMIRLPARRKYWPAAEFLARHCRDL